MAMYRAIYVGSLVSERDFYRASRPGMNVDEYHKIEDLTEREEYKKICNTLQRTMRFPRTQNQNTRQFFAQRNISFTDNLTDEHLYNIQEKLKDRFRLIYVKYHQASGACSIEWKGEYILPRVIFIVSDGVKWDALTGTHGIFGKFLCSGCLKPSTISDYHSALLVEGNCNGPLRLKCDSCHMTFKTDKCYQAHLRVRRTLNGQSRCDTLKLCTGCSSIYRTVNGHNCGESVYCGLCREYKNNQHPCFWPSFSPKQRARLQKKQAEFKFGFFDIETTQNHDFAENEKPRFFDQHFATTISLCKICHLCEHSPIDEACRSCGVRKVTFQYQSADEDPFKVVDDFCDFLLTDKTMKNRTLLSHNGGRFDSHLITRGWIRKGIIPNIVNKGTTIIRAETKTRSTTIVLKDSFAIIPMGLAEFPRAFSLGDSCNLKGIFPHFCNTRKFWGKVWSTLPPKRYFGPEFMKGPQRAAFEDWYESRKDSEFDQDAELRIYCENDALICMLGTMEYRRTMIQQTGWCPITCANTLASFCQFQLRTEFLEGVQMPYLNEQGYGNVNQSVIALRYILWREKLLGRPLRHARSAEGEKKVPIDGQTFSLDCFDSIDDRCIEVMGCLYHGCKRCYLDGTKLLGGERAEDIYARTMDRIAKLRTRFSHVEVVWECEIHDALEANAEMRTFFKETEIIERMKIREALYGGRVEVLRSFAESTDQSVIKYYDVCSMYPSVMTSRMYPLGHPEIILEGFKPIVNNVYPYSGIAKVRVLPPRNLKLAVLPLRHNGALFFPNCYSCVIDRSEHCTHDDEAKRSFVGSWATVELNLALQKGYKVIQSFEVYHFTEWTDKLYLGYFQKFMAAKFAASGFPADVVTPAEKEEYCRKINAKLGLGLRPTDIKYSSSLRVVSKFMNNSCWGKLAELATHRKTQYMTVSAYLKLRLDASRVVNDFKFETDDIMLVTHSPRIETIRANKFSAVHHAVTAYARVLLYSVVEKAGAGAIYMDTDSVMFEMERGGEDPLAHLLTGELGDLTDEIKPGHEIKQLIVAGCKSYSMQIQNLATGETETKLASKGFTKDVQCTNALRHEVICDMVLKKEPPLVEITRPELKRKFSRVYSLHQTKRFKPVSIKRATRGEGTYEIKVPYGYIE